MPKPKKSSADYEDDIDPNTGEKVLPYVTSPSGAKVPLMNQLEVEHYLFISERYQKDNVFTNISDLLELDRLLNYEIMCFRWNHFIMMGHDYDGVPVMSSLSKDLQLYSKEIRDIKSGLNMDKKSRDRDKGQSTAENWTNLMVHAKEMGIHRDEQVIKAHTLWKELEGLYTLYKNSSDTERTTFNCHEKDLFAWLEEKFIEFDEIDKAFRLNQKIWIRTLNS